MAKRKIESKYKPSPKPNLHDMELSGYAGVHVDGKELIALAEEVMIEKQGNITLVNLTLVCDNVNIVDKDGLDITESLVQHSDEPVLYVTSNRHYALCDDELEFIQDEY